MTDKPLSVRRAKDRETMARQLTEALQAEGAECDEETPRPREIVVRIFAHGGAYCYADFDGDSSQPETWVCTWNLRGARRFRLTVRHDDAAAPDGVVLRYGDEVWPDATINTFHRQKATRVFHSFSELVDGLASDVRRFAEGSVYLDPEIDQ